MQVRNIGTAAFVVLAAGAMAYAGSGVGFAAGHGHHHGHGATAFGGFSGATLFQQNTAQTHRQNNNCSDDNQVIAPSALTGSRVKSRCVTRDASFNKHTVVISGGAHANGGSSTASSLSQQNTAQKGRQNNNCATTDESIIALTGDREVSHCTSLDRSRNIHTLIKSRGAHADGGSGALFGTFQQNTAQDGRQNNNCSNLNNATLTAPGGHASHHCTNRDRSHNKHVVIKTRGAHAEGGSAAGFAENQNTAQEGRQNNNCSDEADTQLTLTGSRADTRCTNKDGSFNKGTLIRGGGADVQGGSSITGLMTQQNVAQEGRQNNNCDTQETVALPLAGSRKHDRCTNRDRSHNKHVVIKTRGAHAEGGSAAVGLVENQNTAQEGRQNNNCDRKVETRFALTGSSADTRCTNKDGSFNKGTLIRGGGADVQGGSSITGAVRQQNVAQEGRQNNNCDAQEDVLLTLAGSRKHDRCATVDHSHNVHTIDESGGAETEGGSSVGDLFQQNVAQDGRQNNNCDNSNALTLTATGSRLATECVAVDKSKNIHTITR